MDLEKILENITKKSHFLEGGELYQELFTLIEREEKTHYQGLAKSLVSNQYVEVSKSLEKSYVQEAVSVRNVLKARAFAISLIKDNGELDFQLLSDIIDELKNNLYSFGPNRDADAPRDEHILSLLEKLKSNLALQGLLKAVTKPYSHPYAEQIIKITLGLPLKGAVTDADARRAALSTLLCTLRQSVGSCFATAPAILIHREQPENFLKDLNELMNRGRISRVVAGYEYTAPLSTSWGAGDLKKNFILSRGLKIPSLEIWLSPGFIQALEEVNVLDKNESLQKKREKTKEILANLTLSWKEPGDFFITNMEELLNHTLLEFYELKESDIEEYQNRNQGMIQSSLLMQVPGLGKGTGGRAKPVHCFYKALSLPKRHSKP